MQRHSGSGSDFVAVTAQTPGSAKPDPILIADHITRTFGGLTAVNVAHLEIQRGSITALIGPNGAGKTTFFNLLTGYDSPNSGSWSFNEKALNGIPPHKVARLGMVYRLTVLENMALGARGQRGESVLTSLFPWLWRAQEKEITEKAISILTNFKLIEKKDDFAAALSGGQRKLLEMARALMVEPEMVMLDEPMAGVNPALKQSLLEHIKELRNEGKTVLFVEHDMDMVHEISDWVVVMSQGEVIAEGTPTSVMKNEQVIEAYLGAHHNVDLSAEGEK
jgi:branched-chain amino acid transport system ATP-binding protein